MKNNLAWKYVKATPRRSMLTIFGIAMALAMMMCIGNAITTILESSRQALYKEYGTWESMFAVGGVGATEQDIAEQNNIADTASVYEQSIAFFPQSKEAGMDEQEWLRSGQCTYISADENITGMMNVVISEGRFPANDSEAVVTKYLAEEMGLKLGDTLEVEAGKLSEGDYITDEYGIEMAELTFNGTERKHTIVGIIDEESTENQGFFRVNHLILTGRNAEKPGFILANYIKGTNVVLRSEQIATDLGLDINELENNIAVYTNNFASMMTQMFMIGVIFLFCCSLVAFAAISIVRNSFSMSVTERMRDYGLLRCAGATQQQIKRLIRNEVLIMLGVAFPLSLLISYVASAGVLGIVNGMELLGIPKLHLTVSWVFILISLGVALLSVVIAVISPSKKASTVSPILITTGQDDAEAIQAKAVAKKSKLGRLLGMEWELASRNRRAAGKRSRTTVFSMTVSVGLLLATAGMMQTYLLPSMQEAESEIDIVVQTMEYEDEDERMTDEELNNYASEAIKLDGVKSWARIDQQYLYSTMVDRQHVQNVDFMQTVYGGDDKNIYMPFRLNFIGKEEYTQLQKANGELAGLSYTDWVAGGEAILNDYIKASEYNDFGREVKSSRQNALNIAEGSRLELTIDTTDSASYETVDGQTVSSTTAYGEDIETFGWSVAIGKKINNKVWFDDMFMSESTPIIYLPKEAAAENAALFEDSIADYKRMLLLQTDTMLNKEVEDALYTGDALYVNNYYQEEVLLRNVILLISICVYSFVGVIALISCLNIVNIIGTNLVLRRRDFGLLQAVGMNVSQMRKMILFECVQFSLRSMVYGSILGFAALMGLHIVITSQASTGFYISPLTVLGIFAGCFMVSIIASWPTWKKMKKVSIMESVRHIG